MTGDPWRGTATPVRCLEGRPGVSKRSSVLEHDLKKMEK